VKYLSDIENVKDAIKTAIQMEKDGYAFYMKAAAQTNSSMGKTIFEGLASDEEMHLDVFEKLFQDTIGSTEWDQLVNSSKKYANIPIFPKGMKDLEETNPDTSEIDALRIAMDAEKEAIDYYSEIKVKINDGKIQKIIDEIIEQEKSHYYLLEQEFNHISSNGYWYEFDYLGG
jgi:rubrerythrin